MERREQQAYHRVPDPAHTALESGGQANPILRHDGAATELPERQGAPPSYDIERLLYEQFSI